jgi:hypothetical protein
VIPLRAQIAGEPPAEQDTLVVFEPARPLLATGGLDPIRNNAAGIDLLFSSSGWGLGGFYHRELGGNVTAFAHLGISGSRNSDEFENVWLGPIPVVGNKVNRLFMFPVSVGIQYRLFSESLQENFRPFLSAGGGPTFILATPYIRDGEFVEFFSSFGRADLHTRFGSHVGIGTYFGAPSSGSVMAVQIRYFHIPFGGDGLESIRGNPITNFGGVFLSLTVGSMY